jgi:hypothetical protein
VSGYLRVSHLGAALLFQPLHPTITVLFLLFRKGKNCAVSLGLEGAGKGIMKNSRCSRGLIVEIRLAQFFGSLSDAEVFLDKDSIDLDSKSESGWTPLPRAAGNKHEAVVKLLLDKNRRPGIFGDIPARSGS